MCTEYIAISWGNESCNIFICTKIYAAKIYAAHRIKLFTMTECKYGIFQ